MAFPNMLGVQFFYDLLSPANIEVTFIYGHNGVSSQGSKNKIILAGNICDFIFFPGFSILPWLWVDQFSSLNFFYLGYVVVIVIENHFHSDTFGPIFTFFWLGVVTIPDNIALCT